MDQQTLIIAVIVGAIVLAGVSIFLAPNNPYDAKKKDGSSSPDNIQKLRLGVSDGMRFGFGFGLGLFFWGIFTAVLSILMGGVIFKNLFSNFF